MVARILKGARLKHLADSLFRSKAEIRPRLTGQEESESDDASESLNSKTSDVTDASNLEKLDKIAEASIQLASLGPRLSKLAAEMETQAQAQAQRASTIAKTMESLTHDLEKAVSELGSSSSQVGEALDTVSRIAEHTRIISFNASIEAARAGIHGQAFGVIVEEVQRLADRTGSTTHLIEARMAEMKSSITRVASVAGDQSEAKGTHGGQSVEAVNHEVHGMARSAKSQLSGSQSLHEMSDHVLGLAESLLLSVGAFRFEAHKRAEHEVSLIIPEVLAAGQSRNACERIMERWLNAHPYFELAYITDAKGRQFIDNIKNREGSISHDPAGYGRDWSERPWYLAAIGRHAVHSTDIYRSTATGEFCFTVAVALRDDAGMIVGVLGADVNFKVLLSY